MSYERQWADRTQLGRGSLNNYDDVRDLTVYQFIVNVEGEFYDKYIQAPELDEAKSIMLDHMIEEDVDLATVTFYLITVPTNDVLSSMTKRMKN